MSTSNAPTYAEIAEMLRDRVEDFAEHVIGERPTSRSRGELRFFADGKLRVKLQGKGRGRWSNFADSQYGDMLDLYIWKTGASKHDAADYAKAWLGISNDKPLPALPRRDPKEIEKEAAEEESHRLKTAAWLWGSSSTSIHPMATAYLASRKITVALPSCVRTRVIRITPKMIEKLKLKPHEAEAVGAGPLVAAVFGATDKNGTVRAVQQILLKDAKKAPIDTPKRSNGLLPGAAVRLAEPEDTLILVEGPETGLSIWQATGVATWIVLGSSNFTLVEIPERVKTLILAVDLEEKGFGLAAALKAACFWQAKGLAVKLALPGKPGDHIDFNDILKTGGDEAVRAGIAAAITSADPTRVTREVVLARDPWDAFAIWRATGAAVVPTVRAINPEFHTPEEYPTVRITLAPGEAMPELGTLVKRQGLDLRIIRTGTLSAHTLGETCGDDAVCRLVDTATPHGKEPLYGLERLVREGNAPVFLAATRAAADAAGAAGLVALAFNPKEADAFDWTALRERAVVVASIHSPAGTVLAASAAARARQAGAKDVRALAWPLFAPADAGYAIKHRVLPRGYDFTHAVRDGWTGAHAGALVDLAHAL